MIRNKRGREAAQVPQSRRSQMRAVVRLLCDQVARPVWWPEVLDAARKAGVEGSDELICASLASLVATGDVERVRTGRGGSRGRQRYWLTTLGPIPASDTSEVVWLDAVGHQCMTLWEERRLQACNSGVAPAPFTVGDIRQRFGEDERWPQLKRSQLLINALRQLSQGPEPLLRRYRVKGRAGLLYAPTIWPEDQLAIESTYTSDADRLVEAVRRATARLGRAVTAGECEEEIARDSALQLLGKDSAAFQLSCLGKVHRRYGGNRRGLEKGCLLVVGAPTGATTYALIDPKKPTEDVRRHAARARTLWAGEVWRQLPVGLVMRRLAQEKHDPLKRAWLGALLSEAGALARELAPLGPWVEDVPELVKIREAVLRGQREWSSVMKRIGGTVPEPDARALGLQVTARQAALLFASYRYEVHGGTPEGIVRLFGTCVRRWAPPQHFANLEAGPGKTVHTYDLADLLLYRAAVAGNPTERVYAGIVRERLGLIRDPQVLVAMLCCAAQEDRQFARLALGFLGMDLSSHEPPATAGEVAASAWVVRVRAELDKCAIPRWPAELG